MKTFNCTYIKRVLLIILFLISSVIFREAKLGTTAMGDYCYVPPMVGTSVPPNVMLMLSIETPMQGAAHPDITCTGDPRSSYSCSPANCRYVSNNLHISNCYDNSKKYYGYFDPDKCYDYSNGVFVPSSSASAHKCSNKWSGNFLNWATTMAVDAMRKSFTGGNRIEDTTSRTVLLGARQLLPMGHSWFPIKRIDSASDYTPFSGRIFIIRYSNGFVVCSDDNGNSTPECSVGETGSGESAQPTGSGQEYKGAYTLKIEVCDPSKGLESNCLTYRNGTTITYKPVGVMQKYANKMRFGLISYAMHNNPNPNRDGGVIRANMKWISPKIPTGMKYHDSSGNLVTCTDLNGCDNPEKEFHEENGIFISNPDNISGASYSGVIPYLNKFGYLSGYKSYDPISEMYYEIIRYFKKLTPSTDNYCNNLPTIDDGAPVYCSSSPWSTSNRLGWRDPYIYWCQRSFIVAVNDANPWLDKRIPGTAFTTSYGGNQNFSDYGTPSNADTSINVSNWTDLVGQYEGITPGNMCIGCVLGGTCDWQANSKYVTNLSRVAGTCPWPPKENSYYIAGLAYYAKMTDLRTDLPGNQTITTYMIDTQESNPNMLVGRFNMLYLAAKFGGFDDYNGNGKPDLTSEWDKNGDGFPDNYFFASDPTVIEASLEKAFVEMSKRTFTGATVATLTSRKGFAAVMLQPIFFPALQSSSGEVNWIGFLRAFWLDFLGNIREDTVEPKWLNLKNLIDKVFQFVATANQDPQAWIIANTTTCTVEGSRTAISNLIPLFEAGCLLANRDPSLRNIYFALNNNSEFTSITDNQVKTFFRNTWATVSSNQNLGITVDDTFTNCLIDYLRGVGTISCLNNSSIASYFQRNLTFQVDSFCQRAEVTGERRWKLPAFVYSSPEIVSNEPINVYFHRYLDRTYLDYANRTKTRNSFAFFGASDGMLRAVRVGYIKSTGNHEKPLRLIAAFNVETILGIGREDWAFIPRNAVPYLIWFGRGDYCYIPVIDYRVMLVDASINGAATANKTVDSWRTLLIGVMGVGGKVLAGYSSSIFVLDLTDWLNGFTLTPKLLWESTLPDQSLTTSFPVVIRRGARDENGEWYVVIGSGPTNPQGTSFVSQPKIYVLNLRNGDLVRTIDIPDANHAVGDLKALDINDDYQEDVIYFGTYRATGSGNLYRLVLASNPSLYSLSKAFTAEAPVFGAPNAIRDRQDNIWIIFGTGRFLDFYTDRNINYSNYLIAFKDTCWDGTCSDTYSRSSPGMVNRTGQTVNITVLETKTVCTCNWDGCANREVLVRGRYNGSQPGVPARGWFYSLNTGEAIFSQPAIVGNTLLTALYKVSADPCSHEGLSYLMNLCWETGLPCEVPAIYTYTGTVGQTLTIGDPRVFLGYGAPPLGQPFQSASPEKLLVQLTGGGVQILDVKKDPGRFIMWIEK